MPRHQSPAIAAGCARSAEGTEGADYPAGPEFPPFSRSLDTLARADLLRRLGRSQQSRAAYDKAIELVGNTAETAYLTRRRDQLG